MTCSWNAKYFIEHYFFNRQILNSFLSNHFFRDSSKSVYCTNCHLVHSFVHLQKRLIFIPCSDYNIPLCFCEAYLFRFLLLMPSSFKATESREQKQRHNQDNEKRNLKPCTSIDQINVNDDTFTICI